MLESALEIANVLRAEARLNQINDLINYYSYNTSKNWTNSWVSGWKDLKTPLRDYLIRSGYTFSESVKFLASFEICENKCCGVGVNPRSGVSDKIKAKITSKKYYD